MNTKTSEVKKKYLIVASWIFSSVIIQFIADSFFPELMRSFSTTLITTGITFLLMKES